MGKSERRSSLRRSQEFSIRDFRYGIPSCPATDLNNLGCSRIVVHLLGTRPLQLWALEKYVHTSLVAAATNVSIT